MKKKKFSPTLLSEEQKKFKLLSEYSFYIGEADDAQDGPEPSAEEEPEMDLDSDEVDDAASSVGAELGVDDATDDTTNDATEDTTDGEESTSEIPPAQSANDDVEVDVTSLVKGSDEAKNAAHHASQNTAELLAKFNELEHKVAAMGQISAKIDGLEQEIARRNPTPVEKLEMRSLNSFPYSVKLSDYWADKEGPYDVMKQQQDKEYVLTQDEVNNTYSDAAIKQTFDPKMYEEEDIDE